MSRNHGRGSTDMSGLLGDGCKATAYKSGLPFVAYKICSLKIKQKIKRQNTAPVQMTIVFKLFCSMPSFDIFHHVSLEELPQELQSLVPGHLRAKVVVAPQEVMEVIHSLRSREAPVVAAEMRPVPPERHSPSEEFDGFIPLQSTATCRHTVRARSKCLSCNFFYKGAENTFYVCIFFFFKCSFKIFKCVSQVLVSSKCEKLKMSLNQSK